jgi:hypothetical protein
MKKVILGAIIGAIIGGLFVVGGIILFVITNVFG